VVLYIPIHLREAKPSLFGAKHVSYPSSRNDPEIKYKFLLDPSLYKITSTHNEWEEVWQ